MTSPRTRIARAIEVPLSTADYVFVHVLLWVVVAGAGWPRAASTTATPPTRRVS